MPVREVGQRWLIKEGSRVAIVAEIIGAPGQNFAHDTRLEVLQVVFGTGFKLGQKTELSFEGEPSWSYELLVGQEKPQ